MILFDYFFSYFINRCQQRFSVDGGNVECNDPLNTQGQADDKTDQELIHYIPILEWLAYVDDVRKYLPKMVENNQLDYKKAVNVIRNA